MAKLEMPRDTRGRIVVGLLAVIVIAGGLGLGMQVRAWLEEAGLGWSKAGQAVAAAAKPKIPNSIMPGPSRGEQQVFALNDSNAQRLRGMNSPDYERFADLAGNYYAEDFIRGFSYEASGEDAPTVFVRIEPEAETLRGRLEARNLKPNFAYQIKVMGDWQRDRTGFELIGGHGRWRLPGDGTNYTDQDYLQYPEKHLVEAYILFDYFITDAEGKAVREFAMDSSLHVLWNATRQRQPSRPEDVHAFVCHASDPAFFARPKRQPTIEEVWAEREHARYRSADQVLRLPPRNYRAVLHLTEESWHANGRDGGYWATVFALPIEFTITPPPDEQDDED